MREKFLTKWQTQDLIYVAGPLDSPDGSIGYLRNLKSMTEHATIIDKMNATAFNPGLDVLPSIMNGAKEHSEYLENDLNMVQRCDALFLCPGWEDSVGSNEEKKSAENEGIPIFTDLWKLSVWLRRPKILAIVGESGSGKNYVADYIIDKYGIPTILSCTDRPIRVEDEATHIFMTPETFDTIEKDDILAYTIFGGYRYTALHSDVKEEGNTYIVDEKGLIDLYEERDKYKIRFLRITRPLGERAKLGKGRISRDNFHMGRGFFDYVVNNDGTTKELEEKIDKVVDSFFGLENKLEPQWGKV